MIENYCLFCGIKYNCRKIGKYFFCAECSKCCMETENCDDQNLFECKCDNDIKLCCITCYKNETFHRRFGLVDIGRIVKLM